eukprot:COSAG02_NODE_8566_length_2522_cov_2.058605_1_plen_101_part_00
MLLLLLLLLSWPDSANGRRKKHSGTKPAEAAPGLPPVVQYQAAGMGSSETELYSAGTEHLNQNRLLEALASFDGAVAASPKVRRGLHSVYLECLTVSLRM